MGLDINAIRFLLDARAKGASFDRVASIGRQTLQIDSGSLQQILCAYGIDVSSHQAEQVLTAAQGFSEPLLRLLGASSITSIDVSDYQHASFVHDMNAPLPSMLREQFDAVIDGGSLEHVFDFPRAIANCMDMVVVGGHYLSTTPVNNFMGHGFYQFSPELFYRVFSPANGFVTERMVIYEDAWPYAWHEVQDPEVVRQRVTLVNRRPTLLLVAARKKERRPLFTPVPQQSDYVVMWQDSSRQPQTSSRWSPPASNALAKLRDAGMRFVPPALRNYIRSLRRGDTPFDRRFYREL